MAVAPHLPVFCAKHGIVANIEMIRAVCLLRGLEQPAQAFSASRRRAAFPPFHFSEHCAELPSHTGYVPGILVTMARWAICPSELY